MSVNAVGIVGLGLDTVYYTALTLYEELGEERFRPPRLLERIVQSGCYGAKNGQDFYNHAKPGFDGDTQARTLDVARLFR